MAIDLSSALDAVDAVFGSGSVYTPPLPAAGEVPVIAISATNDADLQLGVGRVVSSRGIFEVQASHFSAVSAPDPERGGTLVTAGGSWRIEAPPEMLDVDRRVWTLRCVKVS